MIHTVRLVSTPGHALLVKLVPGPASGEAAEAVTTHGPIALPGEEGSLALSGLPVPRIATQGTPAGESLRDYGHALGSYLVSLLGAGARGVAIDLRGNPLCASPGFEHVLGGLLRSASQLRAGLSIDVVLDSPGAWTAAMERQVVLHRASLLAAELTDARSNQLTPSILAQRLVELAAQHGVGARLRQRAELVQGGFGALLAIGKGSPNEGPIMLELWTGHGGAPAGAEPPRGAVGLAGKGVTFDSGGLSLKPASGMYSMHTDCAGAAAVAAAVFALAEVGTDVPVYAALPLVENLPGPDAIRPGDVVTARDGTAIEIVDTDFEGRVILSDALALLSESEPAAVLSFATLTYQIEIALGPEIAGLFARDDALATRVLEAAGEAGEALWRMPFAQRYGSQLSSGAPGAAVRNHPLADTGRAITAALFLGRFVPDAVPFAHVDCAGPAVTTAADGPHATGWGVRTIVEVVQRWVNPTPAASTSNTRP